MKNIKTFNKFFESKEDMKYSAIAFNGLVQKAHLQDDYYSDDIEDFIKENEARGFKVMVSFVENGKAKRIVYQTNTKTFEN